MFVFTSCSINKVIKMSKANVAVLQNWKKKSRNLLNFELRSDIYVQLTRLEKKTHFPHSTRLKATQQNLISSSSRAPLFTTCKYLLEQSSDVRRHTSTATHRVNVIGRKMKMRKTRRRRLELVVARQLARLFFGGWWKRRKTLWQTVKFFSAKKKSHLFMNLWLNKSSFRTIDEAHEMQKQQLKKWAAITRSRTPSETFFASFIPIKWISGNKIPFS